jgi:hypothetical protein
MPLYTRGGSLLEKAGALADSTACCCDPPPTACLCSGSSVVVPASVSLEVSLGALQFSSGSCTDADVEAFIEGTYVLPFWFGDTTAANYQTTLANGMVVTFSWYCATASHSGSSANAIFSFDYCDGSKTCIARYISVYAFDAIGGTTFGAEIPTMCGVTTGDTTAYTISYGDPKSFEQGPLSCLSVLNAGRRRYNMTVTMTPTW